MLIYGSMLCPDCVECCKDLDAAGIPYTFCEFNENLAHLKAFLKLRDTNSVFESVYIIVIFIVLTILFCYFIIISISIFISTCIGR